MAVWDSGAMELPGPNASDELIEHLDEAATSAKDWYKVSEPNG